MRAARLPRARLLVARRRLGYMCHARVAARAEGVQAKRLRDFRKVAGGAFALAGLLHAADLVGGPVAAAVGPFGGVGWDGLNGAQQAVTLMWAVGGPAAGFGNAVTEARWGGPVLVALAAGDVAAHSVFASAVDPPGFPSAVAAFAPAGALAINFALSRAAEAEADAESAE